MDITEKIKEIQSNRDEEIVVFPTAERPNSPSIAEDMDGEIDIETSNSDSFIFDNTSQLYLEGQYTTASTFGPMTMANYIQLTQDDYNSMLERISSLEERLVNLERGIL